MDSIHDLWGIYIYIYILDQSEPNLSKSGGWLSIWLVIDDMY